MTTAEKISIIENCMDMDEGSLSIDSQLSNYEEWDSLTALTLIATVSETVGQDISGYELKKAKTVADIVDLIK